MGAVSALLEHCSQNPVPKLLVFINQVRGVCAYRANKHHTVQYLSGCYSRPPPSFFARAISLILFLGLTTWVPRYLASAASSRRPPFQRDSTWSEACAVGSMPMAQQPHPEAQSRAPGSRKVHSGQPDEAADILDKSLQLGAGAGTISNDVALSLPHIRDADL